MIKCEDGSGVKNGLEFRLPISGAFLPPVLVAPTDRTANEPIAKQPYSKHVWESISQTHVYTYIIIL